MRTNCLLPVSPVSTGFVDTLLSESRLPFELNRADVTDRRVAPDSVVEPLDVIEHIGPRFVTRPIDLAPDAFGPEG